MLLAGVRDETSEVGAVIAENEISVLDLFRHSAVDELARRLAARPRPAGGATSGQDPHVTHRRPVLGLEDEPAFAAVLECAAHSIRVLLVGLGPGENKMIKLRSRYPTIFIGLGIRPKYGRIPSLVRYRVWPDTVSDSVSGSLFRFRYPAAVYQGLRILFNV